MYCRERGYNFSGISHCSPTLRSSFALLGLLALLALLALALLALLALVVRMLQEARRELVSLPAMCNASSIPIFFAVLLAILPGEIQAGVALLRSMRYRLQYDRSTNRYHVPRSLLIKLRVLVRGLGNYYFVPAGATYPVGTILELV